MQELTSLTLSFVQVLRNNIKSNQTGEKLLEVLQATLHDWFVQRLGLTRA